MVYLPEAPGAPVKARTPAPAAEVLTQERRVELKKVLLSKPLGVQTLHAVSPDFVALIRGRGRGDAGPDDSKGGLGHGHTLVIMSSPFCGNGRALPLTGNAVRSPVIERILRREVPAVPKPR